MSGRLCGVKQIYVRQSTLVTYLRHTRKLSDPKLNIFAVFKNGFRVLSIDCTTILCLLVTVAGKNVFQILNVSIQDWISKEDLRKKLIKEKWCYKNCFRSLIKLSVFFFFVKRKLEKKNKRIRLSAKFVIC